MYTDIFQCSCCEEIYISFYFKCSYCNRKYCEFCTEEALELFIKSEYQEHYEECIYCTNNLEMREFKKKDIIDIFCVKYNKSLEEFTNECKDFLED